MQKDYPRNPGNLTPWNVCRKSVIDCGVNQVWIKVHLDSGMEPVGNRSHFLGRKSGSFEERLRCWPEDWGQKVQVRVSTEKRGWINLIRGTKKGFLKRSNLGARIPRNCSGDYAFPNQIWSTGFKQISWVRPSSWVADQGTKLVFFAGVFQGQKSPRYKSCQLLTVLGYRWPKDVFFTKWETDWSRFSGSRCLGSSCRDQVSRFFTDSNCLESRNSSALIWT